MPAEIAVSVMAELLAVKNGIQLPREMKVGDAKNLLDIRRDSSGHCLTNSMTEVRSLPI